MGLYSRASQSLSEAVAEGFNVFVVMQPEETVLKAGGFHSWLVQMVIQKISQSDGVVIFHIGELR